MTTARIDDQALDWFVRLRDPDAPEAAWMDFQAWLEADPAHRRAYDQIEQVWVALDDATEVDEAGARQGVANDAWPVPARDRMKARGNRLSRSWTPLLAAAAAAAAAAAVLVVGLWPEVTGVGRFQTFRTTDAPRELVLADGSRLSINRHTNLRVRIGTRGREATLADGEVAFDVTPDADRPFVVAAGARKIHVLGTAFNLLSHDEAFSVGVKRGMVAVSGAGMPDPVRLAAGQQIDQLGEAPPVVRQVDPDQMAAWRQGVLIYRDADLGSVADDLSRYLDKPITVSASAGMLQFTGALRIGDEADMLGQLQDFLPVRVIETAVGLRMETREGA